MRGSAGHLLIVALVLLLPCPEELLAESAAQALPDLDNPPTVAEALAGLRRLTAEMKDCPYEGTAGGFFPKNSVCVESHDRWFSEQLGALEEAPLHPLAAAEDVEIYRFAWFRGTEGWGPVSTVVRVELTATAERSIVTKTIGLKPTGVEAFRSRLSKRAERILRRALRRLDYWSLPRGDGRWGTDGTRLILEGVKGGEYRFVGSWSPDKGPMRKLSRLFREFGRITP